MRETLDESNVAPDPYRQFEHWFAEAVKSQLHEPNAMTLATVDPDGRPAARIVLLKEFDARGFAFFTNYTSRKGRELAANPEAALLFFWPDLERQVRIEGATARLDPRRIRRLFRGSAARVPARRMGVAAKRADRRARGARGALRRGRGAVSRRRATPCPVRRIGAATGWSPSRSSSGKGEPRVCTIAYATAVRGSTPARGSSTGWRRERRRARRLAHARHADPARDRQPLGAGGKPGHRRARRAVDGRIAVHRRRADLALRAAADAAFGRGGPARRPHRRAPADAGGIGRDRHRGDAAVRASRSAGALRERDAARRRVHGVPDRRPRRRPASWASPRRGRAISACSRSATRCRASSGRCSPVSRSIISGFAPRSRRSR